jgi:hypothetical protein
MVHMETEKTSLTPSWKDWSEVFTIHSTLGELKWW